MQRRVLTVDYDQVEVIAKALSSGVRRGILNALRDGDLSIQELAERMGILQSSCTVNVQALERAGFALDLFGSHGVDLDIPERKHSEPVDLRK